MKTYVEPELNGKDFPFVTKLNNFMSIFIITNHYIANTAGSPSSQRQSLPTSSWFSSKPSKKVVACLFLAITSQFPSLTEFCVLREYYGAYV